MTKNIEELEKPAKIWQVADLSEKIDIVSRSQKEIKEMIAQQSSTYPTKSDLQLELRERDHEIANIKKSLSIYSKVVWLVVSALISLFVAALWNLITSAGHK